MTGASKGIGLEIYDVLADAGGDIAAVARDQVGLTEVARKVKASGREAFVVGSDLATLEGSLDAATKSGLL